MIEIIREAQRLDAIAPAWNELAGRFETPLLRHEWFVSCARAFCPPGRLAIVAVHYGGGLAAIAPMTLLRCNGLPTLQLLGSSFLSEPGGFLYRNEDCLQELLNSLLA